MKQRRWVRIVAILLGVLALLVAAIYAAVTLAFPPERLAALLAKQVKEATGRDFRIDGKLSIRVLPTIAVHAGDVVLGNAEWGSRPDMLRVHSAAFELSAMALLAGELRILRVELAGVDALLETDGAGHANWQLASRTPATAQPASAPSAGRASGFAVEHLAASDVRVAYRANGTAKVRVLAIESLDLQTQGERDRIVIAFGLGPQHWKVEGLIGRSTLFLDGRDDWPFDLRLATDGATASAAGTLGTGPRTGAVSADVSAKITSAAALVVLGEAATAVPLPLELRTTLRWGDDRLRAEPLHIALAGQAIDGRATLSGLEARPLLDIELAAKAIDVAKLRGGAPAGKPSPPAVKTSGPLFGDTPLPLDALPPIDMKVRLSIERLKLPDTPSLSALKARLSSTPDRLTLDDLQFGIAGGRARGRMAIALAPGAAPRIELSVDARSMSLEALDAAPGKRVRGGRTDFAANLALTGRTPRSLAAGANGNVQVSVVDATLAGGSAAALDRNVIASVLRLVLPKGSADRPLAVQCAVARLPLRQGIAAIDRSIAFETREVAIVASGNINLVDQTLKLEFEPTVKKGLGLNPAQFAELVRVSGPLQDPKAGVDVKGAVRSAATVGVAVATSGLSLLAPIALEGTKDTPPCGHAKAAAPAKSAPGNKKHRVFGAR